VFTPVVWFAWSGSKREKKHSLLVRLEMFRGHE